MPLPLSLSIKQIKFLRGLAHPLKPVVIIGQHGLTAAVQTEIEQALTFHELIKLRVNAEDRKQRETMIQTILETSRASLVARIGHIAVLYRPNLEASKIAIPK
jgi:RNA-binding protein